MISFLKNFIPHFETNFQEGDAIERAITSAVAIVMLPETYFHEFGHAFAAWSLYSHTKTRIRLIVNTGGGGTKIEKGPPSFLGRFLGDRINEITIQAAGPLFSVIYSVNLAALGLMSSNETIRGSLCMLGIASLSNTIAYSIKGIWSYGNMNQLTTNDFAKLKELGIHPIFPMMGMTIIEGSILYSMFRTS